MTDYVVTKHGVEKCRGSQEDCFNYLVREYGDVTIRELVDNGWKIAVGDEAASVFIPLPAAEAKPTVFAPARIELVVADGERITFVLDPVQSVACEAEMRDGVAGKYRTHEPTGIQTITLSGRKVQQPPSDAGSSEIPSITAHVNNDFTTDERLFLLECMKMADNEGNWMVGHYGSKLSPYGITALGRRLCIEAGVPLEGRDWLR